MQLVFYVNASREVVYVPCKLGPTPFGGISCASDIVHELEISPNILVLSGCTNGRVCKVDFSKEDKHRFKDFLHEHFSMGARIIFPEEVYT